MKLLESDEEAADASLVITGNRSYFDYLKPMTDKVHYVRPRLPNSLTEKEYPDLLELDFTKIEGFESFSFSAAPSNKFISLASLRTEV